MKKRKAGRPKGTHEPAEFTKPVMVRLSEEQLAAMRAAAKEDGRPLAQWMRFILAKAIQKESA